MKKHQLLKIGGRVALAALLFAGATFLILNAPARPEAVIARSDRQTPIVEGPLEAELRWCRHLGDEALRDRNCLRAWTQNRERFLKYAPAGALPTPEGR